MTPAPPAPRPSLSVAEAKAALHAWGEENQTRADALRASAAIGLTRLATGGGITLVAALLIRRLIPRRVSRSSKQQPAPPQTATWLRLLTIARVARWAMPHVLSALSTSTRASNSPAAPHHPRP